MSDLTRIEKRKLEKMFEMGGGYVLDFSNRSFEEFFLDSAGIEIYNSRYDYESGSKANRLRGFWQTEPNHIVGRVISDLLEHWKTTKLLQYSEVTPVENALFDECTKIAERLKQASIVEQIDAITPISPGKEVDLLAKSIQESIRNNEPETALDRLHTYVVKYVRQLCNKHGITNHKDKPLHSLFGEYVKALKSAGRVESQMTERILKSSISVLEAYNDVRNNQSFAHDNHILNYRESILILNNVTSVIKFIQSLESEEQNRAAQDQASADWSELPF